MSGTSNLLNAPRRRKRREGDIGPGGAAGGRLTASEFARRKLGFAADEKQAAVLDSEAKRGILNCTRQWGKSTVLAAKAVHRVWTQPRVLVLVASPGKRQSRLFLRKAAEFLAKLGIRRRGDGDNEASLLLPNGSRIVGLPGTEATVRKVLGGVDGADRRSGGAAWIETLKLVAALRRSFRLGYSSTL